MSATQTTANPLHERAVSYLDELFGICVSRHAKVRETEDKLKRKIGLYSDAGKDAVVELTWDDICDLEVLIGDYRFAIEDVAAQVAEAAFARAQKLASLTPAYFDLFVDRDPTDDYVREIFAESGILDQFVPASTVRLQVQP